MASKAKWLKVTVDLRGVFSGGNNIAFLPLEGAVYRVVACPNMGHEV